MVDTTFSPLTALLGRMDVEELTALLSARPDVLAAPAPRSVDELALRLDSDHSVRAALHHLPMPAVQLAEVLQALGDGCRRAELERLLHVGDALDGTSLDELLGQLRRLALAWTDGPVLRITPALNRLTTDPLALGPPAAELLADLTVEQLTQIASHHGIAGQRRKAEWVSALCDVLADAGRLRTALASAPPEVAETVERLTWHSPRAYGPMQVALYRVRSFGLIPATSWLVQHGFLLPAGWDEGRMPREVALALRGEDYRPSLTTDRPVLATAQVGAVPIPPPSVVEGVQRMLTAIGTSPLQQLAAGGIGVRELRRTAKELGSTEGPVRLWLELAAAAGLVHPDDGGEVLPTAAADTWLAETPGARLVTLISAWRELPAVPSHRVDADGKLQPALGPGNAARIGPPLRTDLFELLGELPAGTAVTDVDTLIDLLAWRHPVRYHDAEALAPYLVASWTEAQRLGLVVDGTLSDLGRAVATGASETDLAELAGQILPAPVHHATLLPDLTAVVSGPPDAELTALLDAVADQESRDTASTWRLSPASVRRALDAGHTAAGLLARLTEVADRPLPQPVEYLINDAARRHGQLQVRTVCCAVCTSDPALAAEIAAHRKLAELDLQQLSATVLGSAKPGEQTLRLLRAAGYSPVQQSRTGQTVVERVAPRRAATRPQARQPARQATTVEPAVLAQRLAAGTGTELPVTEHELEVQAVASALDEAQARLLAHAIEHGSPIRIDYASSSGGYTERVIEPMAMFFDAVQAWCRLRNGERVFRLDRIRAVAPA
ncbi:MAG: helicase-associated domain-containing protein [Pseudonocardiaceae bacterium]